jgi:hypothetical protein
LKIKNILNKIKNKFKSKKKKKPSNLNFKKYYNNDSIKEYDIEIKINKKKNY